MTFKCAVSDQELTVNKLSLAEWTLFVLTFDTVVLKSSSTRGFVYSEAATCCSWVSLSSLHVSISMHLFSSQPSFSLLVVVFLMPKSSIRNSANVKMFADGFSKLYFCYLHVKCANLIMSWRVSEEAERERKREKERGKLRIFPTFRKVQMLLTGNFVYYLSLMMLSFVCVPYKHSTSTVTKWFDVSWSSRSTKLTFLASKLLAHIAHLALPKQS